MELDSMYHDVQILQISIVAVGVHDSHEGGHGAWKMIMLHTAKSYGEPFVKKIISDRFS